jgi:hypothetical protein
VRGHVTPTPRSSGMRAELWVNDTRVIGCANGMNNY